MEENKLNSAPIPDSSIASILENEGFSHLSEETQRIVLDKLPSNRDRDGGLMGKLFGSKKENASLNIAFTICVLLALIGVICMVCGYECWNVIIPAIMTAVGYIFGRGERE